MRDFRGMAAAVLVFASLAQAAPFTNGSFESPGGSTTVLGVGSTHVTGWIHGVTDGADYLTVSGHFGIAAGDGNYYITWGGSGVVGGTLSQTFDTTPGATYVVNYLLTTQQYLLPNPPFQTNSVQALDGATVLGSTSNSFNMAAGNWLAGNQLAFIAASSTTTLVFTDTSNPQASATINWGLDAVTVAEVAGGGVPEPSTYGLVALALGMIGIARRKGHDKLNKWQMFRSS
ncbi:MAG: DUF642 domain-containing protein [Acidobacteria bacterium]|nr:DUF642 domain-containing protein [Acidobacteriota bacterium]